MQSWFSKASNDDDDEKAHKARERSARDPPRRPRCASVRKCGVTDDDDEAALKFKSAQSGFKMSNFQSLSKYFEGKSMGQIEMDSVGELESFVFCAEKLRSTWTPPHSAVVEIGEVAAVVGGPRGARGQTTWCRGRRRR